MKFLFLTLRFYLQKNIQPLSENFWLVCRKCKLGVQANKLWEICFWRSGKLFNIFLFWAKTFRTFGKKFSADLSKMQSRGTISGEKFCWKNYMFLLVNSGLRAKLFENFDGNISIRLSNLHFTCPGEESETKSYWKRKFLFNSVTLVKDLRPRAKTFQ